MKKNEWITLIILIIAISAIVAYITGAITGNIIKVPSYRWGTEVYTKTEIDAFNTEIDDTITRIYTMIDGKTTNQGVLDMFDKKCTIWSVAVPNATRQVTGDEICKERNAGTCVLMINYDRFSSNDMIQKCTPYVTGKSDETVAYCCSP